MTTDLRSLVLTLLGSGVLGAVVTFAGLKSKIRGESAGATKSEGDATSAFASAAAAEATRARVAADRAEASEERMRKLLRIIATTPGDVPFEQVRPRLLAALEVDG